MKKYLIPVAAMAVALFTTIASAEDAAKTVEIEANDSMKFNVTEIQVAPGQDVTITLKNVGTMPKLSMGHNFVVLVQGTDVTAFTMKAMTQASNDYIPLELKDQIIAHTKLLGPGESDTITFKAPETAGDYEFICSFPGHAAAGMKGVLKVQ